MILLNQKFLTVSLFSCLLLAFTKVSGQETSVKREGKTFVRQDFEDLSTYGFGSQNCESLRRNLEVFLLENEKITPNSTLIIIFRMEKGENQNLYPIRRRKLAYWFNLNFKNRYIVALGDPVENTGRADIYADGKMAVGFGFKKNSKNICQNY